MNRHVALAGLWASFLAASVGVGFAAAGVVSDPFLDSTPVGEVPGAPRPGDFLAQQSELAAALPTPDAMPTGGAAAVGAQASHPGAQEQGLTAVSPEPQVGSSARVSTPAAETGAIAAAPTHDRPGAAPTHDRPGAAPTHDRPGAAPTHDRPGAALTHDRPGVAPTHDRPGVALTQDRPGSAPDAGAVPPAAAAPPAQVEASEPQETGLQTSGGYVHATCAGPRLTLQASPAVGWKVDRLDDDGAAEGRVRFELADDRDGRVDVRADCHGGGPRIEVREVATDPDSSGPGG